MTALAILAAAAFIGWTIWDTAWWAGYLDALDDRDVINDVFRREGDT